jgi:lipid II:glycine glycyltransferase (peptidoglycan interpeptide bridge formation enzyme)
LDDPFSDGTRSGISKSSVYAFHRIDLTPSEESIYRGFHDSCVRRKIRKAERENLNYEAGCSEELLAKFRHLLLKTRRRHMLPPQPSLWFQNLLKCLGSCVKIHVLSQQSTPVAAILTLSFRDSLTYKYGCSDERFHKLGGMPLLFWKAIQEAKRDGMKDLDLGRSSYEDPGLSAFKMHLGASESELNYYRSPASPPLPKKQEFPFVRQALVRLPDSAFARVGRLSISTWDNSATTLHEPSFG